MVSRLQLINSHLAASRHFAFKTEATGLDDYRKRGTDFNPALLRTVLQGSLSEYLDFLLATAEKLPIMRNTMYHDLSRAGMRELLVRQIAAYFQATPLTYEQDQADLRKLLIFLLGLWAVNQGLCIRLAVHLILYGDSIRCLGTEKHIPYLQRAFSLKDYGSFCMTELGHGSNAGGVETIAVYDLATKEFELHSPTPMAAKWWIGAVGKTANMSVVFARLILSGKDVGVHVFLVPIRHYETHDPMPGVILGDCGPKEGVHGIDNGFVLFDHYRVPYDSLLDKFSHISADGKLKTTIKNKDKRFAAMLSAFTRGRTGIVCGSLMAIRNAMTIAVRYAAVRRQFGQPGKPEVPILDYPLHRFRLMPHLANLFAANQGAHLIISAIEKNRQVMSESPEGPEANELHALLSVCKVLSTWYAQRAVQESRESLAGHGYSAFSGLGTLLTDNDVNATWEGENNVLIQQTARFVFKNIQKMMKGQRVESEYVTFLTLDLSKVESEKAGFKSVAELRGNLPLLRQLMEHRTNWLVAKSMTKLQENSGKFETMFDTWNHTQVFYMQPLAIAFGEKVLCDELAKVTEATTAKCKGTGEVLARLVELFVMSKVVGDLGTFRDGEYMSSEQAQIVKDYVADLCNEVGENSVKIIDAIAIPDKLLGSPFGQRDGQMYRAYTELVESADGCYEKPTWLGFLKEVRKVFPNP